MFECFNVTEKNTEIRRIGTVDLNPVLATQIKTFPHELRSSVSNITPLQNQSQGHFTYYEVCCCGYIYNCYILFIIHILLVSDWSIQKYLVMRGKGKISLKMWLKVPEII